MLSVAEWRKIVDVPFAVIEDVPIFQVVKIEQKVKLKGLF